MWAYVPLQEGMHSRGSGKRQLENRTRLVDSQKQTAERGDRTVFWERVSSSRTRVSMGHPRINTSNLAVGQELGFLLCFDQEQEGDEPSTFAVLRRAKRWTSRGTPRCPCDSQRRPRPNHDPLPFLSTTVSFDGRLPGWATLAT
jgi:hypothetical protein